MAEHRIEKREPTSRDAARQLLTRATQNNPTAEQYIIAYSAAFKNDDLTKLSGYLGEYRANDPAE